MRPDGETRGSLQSSLSDSLLGRTRRVVSSDRLYSELHESPLHDLAPIAQPGLTTRVSRNSSVGSSLDAMGDAFLQPGELAEDIVVVEGGLTPSLLATVGVALLSALLFGFHFGNMNTASRAMRSAMGISSSAAAALADESARSARTSHPLFLNRIFRPTTHLPRNPHFPSFKRP